MKPEAKFKVELIRQIRAKNGYGRRIEDTYAVGVYDCILIPHGGPVFFAEAKIVRGRVWGPSPRQELELSRVRDTHFDGAVPIVVGLDEKSGVLYLASLDMTRISAYAKGWDINDCLKWWRESDGR